MIKISSNFLVTFSTAFRTSVNIRWPYSQYCEYYFSSAGLTDELNFTVIFKWTILPFPLPERRFTSRRETANNYTIREIILFSAQKSTERHLMPLLNDNERSFYLKDEGQKISSHGRNVSPKERRGRRDSTPINNCWNTGTRPILVVRKLPESAKLSKDFFKFQQKFLMYLISIAVYSSLSFPPNTVRKISTWQL